VLFFLFYIGSACVVFGLALEGFVLFLVGDIVNHYFLTTLPVYFSTIQCIWAYGKLNISL